MSSREFLGDASSSLGFLHPLTLVSDSLWSLIPFFMPRFVLGDLEFWLPRSHFLSLVGYFLILGIMC